MDCRLGSLVTLRIVSMLLEVALILSLATHGWAADKSGVKPTSISLPSGPGSIEGLGESFQPALNTGTAKYNVPLRVPPGTAGQTPSLVLTYDGGGGNGPLGFGWTVPLPYVQRQTDKGIPRYVDSANGVDDDGDGNVDEPDEVDVFINDMKEELVQLADGDYFCKNEGAFIRYRPVGDHWEANRPDGTLLEFGLTPAARLTDETGTRVFRWLLERSTDTNGNTIVYVYGSFPGEANINQKYLSRVEYGPGAPPWSNFHFIVFEYEDRPDWFEDCRSGFLVRTGKRVKEIVVGTQGPSLASHAVGDFNDDGTADCLNRRYALAYDAHPHWSLLTSVTWVGADDVTTYPPLSLGYTVTAPPETASAAGQLVGAVNLPLQVMDNDLVDLADMNGDGLPDILKTAAFGGPHTVYLNEGEAEGEGGNAVSWSAGVEVGGDPLAWNINLASATGAVAHLADMDADGLADLVYKSGPDVYYFSNRANATWGARSQMNIDPSDSAPPSPFGAENVKTADLDFDKHMDIIQSVSTGSGADYRIWFNLGDDRFARSVTVSQEAGFMLSDPGVHIADFNGDRVQDVLRVHATGIDVTAGLGFGNFTALKTVPLPDYTLDFEQVRKAQLHDLNGDGLADLVLERAAPGELWYWLNLGNYILDHRRVITGMPTSIGLHPEIRWADLNGNGTTDLVYADGQADPRMQTVDIGRLIGCDPHPNQLVRISNGIGRTMMIEYRSSVSAYAADSAAGRPKRTRLPFPVSIVSKRTVSFGLDLDGVPGEDQYVTEYRYHDGYYDGFEKEFRGFAEVEVVDRGDESQPTLVTRHHFHTGEPDGVDNDGDGLVDERDGNGEPEEESLKGVLLELRTETCVDGPDGACATPGMIFRHELNRWEIRTLYSPHVCTGDRNVGCCSAADCAALGVGDCVPEQPDTPAVFAEHTCVAGSPVRYAVNTGTRSAIIEKGLADARIDLMVETDYDGYGNRVSERNWGIVETASLPPFGCVLASGNCSENPNEVCGSDVECTAGTCAKRSAADAAPCEGDPFSFTNPADPDDERFTRTEYALNLAAWLVNSPSIGEITDDDGTVQARTKSYYDGADFTGLPIGQISRGNLTRTAQWLESEQRDVQRMKHKYDAHGNVIETRDARENRRLLEYDARFHTYPTVEAVQLDGYALTMTAMYDEGFGVVLDSTTWGIDAVDGPAAAFRYDQFARLVKIVQPGDTLEKPTSSFEYHLNERGDGVNWIVTRHREESGEAGTIDSFAYVDGLGRKLGIKEEGDGNQWVFVDGTAYNRRGMTRSTWLPYFTDTLEYEAPSPSAAREASVLDETGRVVRTINADGTFSTSTFVPLGVDIYDENDTGGLTPQGFVSQRRDGLDRLVRIIERNAGEEYVTHYRYDPRDNLVEIVDAQGNRTHLAYDSLSRRTFLNDPDRGHVSFRFDDADNLIETIDAKGQRTIMAYDAANRLVSENYLDRTGDSATDPVDVTYEYDFPATGGVGLGNGTSGYATFTAGELSIVRDLSGEEHKSYDARRRPAWEVKLVRDPELGVLVPYVTYFTHDSRDRVTSIRYPDGDRVDFSYGRRGLLQRIRGGEAGLELVRDVAYEPSGQLARIVYGNGVTTELTYDARQRPETTRTRGAGLTEGTDLLYYRYTFDPVSNAAAIEDLRTSAPPGTSRHNTQRFAYDDLHRLTTFRLSRPANPTATLGTITYSFDGIGNMLSQTSDIIHVEGGRSVTDLGSLRYGGTAGRSNRDGRAPDGPPGPHALTAGDNGSVQRHYRYDDNGNMTDIDGLQAAWDFKDRMVAIESSRMRAEYVYDYADRRVTKKVTAKVANGGALSGDVSVTQYVGRAFEMRSGQPTKFVFLGGLRVAEVTGTLDATAERVQRFSLRPGWNLLSLGVDAANAATQLGIGAHGPIAVAYAWDPEGGGYRRLSAESALPAGTVFWVYATQADVVAVQGQYPGPANLGAAPSGFLPAPGLESLALGRALPATAAAWMYDGALQRWRWLSGQLAFLSDLQPYMVPGQALYLLAASPSELLVPATTARVRYYHPDHLGSTNVLTDGAGNLVEETAFYPFGQPRYRLAGVDFGLPSSNYLFTQKERDWESGLNLFEARFYASDTARFTAVDAEVRNREPVPDPQRLNAYSYGLNNPVRFVDPSGDTASDLAAWWEKQASQSMAALENFVQEHPSTGSVIGATAVATAIELGRGVVDVLRLGEGVAEGSASGVVKDVLRATTVVTAVAKGGQVLARGGRTLLARANALRVGARARRLAKDPSRLLFRPNDRAIGERARVLMNKAPDFLRPLDRSWREFRMGFGTRAIQRAKELAKEAGAKGWKPLAEMVGGEVYSAKQMFNRIWGGIAQDKSIGISLGAESSAPIPWVTH